MPLLYTQNIQDELIYQLEQVTESIQIITAYCKLNAIKLIEKHIPDLIDMKRILVRFRLNDILSGATDIEMYEFCKKNGWELYVRFDLHAKTYIFDNEKGIVGSANATSNGLGLYSDCNYELGSLIPIDAEDINKINLLFNSGLKINDEIYQRMKANIDNSVKSKSEKAEWDKSIQSLCNQEIDSLFTYDFPPVHSIYELNDNKFDFLNCKINDPIENIKEAFIQSKCYQWLKEYLLTQENNEVYFGALSQAIHEIVINDPKPYRKEIKVLQSNLLNWVSELNVSEIRIDRPNHSERIRLTL